MKWFIIIISITLVFCSPKGPQTFDSVFIGKTKSDLIAVKGVAKEIKIFDKSEVYVYTTKEEYYGKKTSANSNKMLTPKKVWEIEHIYYINEKGYIYKYQVWKKRID
ncbi:MAG: hypothetical protein COA97_04525 [Flavobacteriales bacterium]|nr:MAG: hypothetical protein COA97_04525 [Flavobacteriales bacterium]